MHLSYPFNLLDDCHVNYDVNQAYDIYEVDARELLTFARFDIYANLFYLRALDTNSCIKYAQDLYFARTAAITGFKISEPGNLNKNNFADFVNAFAELFDSIKSRGFDDTKSLIPIDKSNILIDGAHRLSIAAYLGLKVKVCKLSQEFDKPLTVPYSFFKSAGISQSFMDTMAIEFCRWHKNIHMLFIWPKAYVSPLKSKADKFLEDNVNVVYRKKIKLTYNAIRNLILQIYHNVPWMGNIEEGFKWSYRKADEEYYGDGSMEVVLIEDEQGLEHITKVKAELRSIYQIGLESIHSTDTYEEAWIAANLMFNENSLHHLENSKPDRFVKSFNLFMEYRRTLLDSGCNLEDYIIDSSMAMALYGIREAGDLDYMRIDSAHDLVIDMNDDKRIENNDKNIAYHKLSVSELIYNPENYYVFMGVKVLSLRNLVAFKLSRGKSKDLKDIKIIKPYLHGGTQIKKYIERLKLANRIRMKYLKSHMQSGILKLLHWTRLYKPVRSIYRCIKRK